MPPASPPEDGAPAGVLTDEERALAARLGTDVALVHRHLATSREAVLRGRLAALARDWQTAIETHPGLLSESVDRAGKRLSPAVAMAHILAALVVAHDEHDLDWLSPLGKAASAYLAAQGSPGPAAWPEQREALLTELQEELRRSHREDRVDREETAARAAVVVHRAAFAPQSRPAGLLAARGILPPDALDLSTTPARLLAVREAILPVFGLPAPDTVDVELVVLAGFRALGMTPEDTKNLY